MRRIQTTLKSRYMLAGLLLMAVLAIFVLVNKDGQRSTADGNAVLRPIPTAVVREASNSHTRTFPGKVRAARRVELAFSVSGVLEHLNADEGRSFRQGDIIARLDQQDSQHALDMATVKAQQAARELSRNSELWKKKAVSRSDYENALTAHAVAQIELRICKKALEDTVLVAPFDGVVAKRHVEPHEYIQAQKAIVSLQDISHIEIVIQVPERMFAHGGTKALHALLVRFDADGSRWFNATVREHSAKSDAVTRTYDVVLSLPPPADLSIFPGMTAEVKAQINGVSDALSPGEVITQIPAQALCRGHDGQSYVWIISPTNNTVTKRTVDAAELRGDFIAIRSGLNPGEHVAIAGQHMLHENILVRPMVNGKDGLDG